MKTGHNALKNIRKIYTFFAFFIYVQMFMAKMLHLSGFPSLGRSKNQSLIAVNMAEFPQFGGVQL